MNFAHADHRFEQEPTEPPLGGKAKKVIDVNAGPFAALSEKRAASLMQKIHRPVEH